MLLVLVAAACAGCRGRITVHDVEVSLAPLTGSQGQTLTLFVTGIGTSFHGDDPSTMVDETDPVVSVVGGPATLLPGRVNVDGPHRARVRLYITPDAEVTDGSARTLRVVTAGREFDFDFTVTGSTSLPSISLHPDTGFAGISSMTVDVEALGGIQFDQDDTVVAFPEDSGIEVLSVTIPSALSTSMEVLISIADSAPVQSFPVTITSGGSVATHPFNVVGGLGPRLYITPLGATAGSSPELELVVADMLLTPADMELRFPYCYGIEVDELLYEDGARATARITILAEAPPGTCQVELESDGSVATGTFRILAGTGTEPFLRLYPSFIERGASGIDITVQGVYTDFSEEESELSIVPGSGIGVDSFVVFDESYAVATLTVASDAPAGPSLFTVTTSGTSASAVLTVIDPIALRFDVDPGEVEQGMTGLVLELDVDGADVLAATSVEVEFPPESGVRTGTLSRSSSTKIDVPVDVDVTAPTGITLVMLTVDGESATAPFVITPATGAPHFTIDPPFLIVPSGEIGITLSGTDTAWVEGKHHLYFSEPSIEVRSFTVIGSGSAAATIRGPAWMDVRRAVAWVASPSDIAGAWWTVLPPGHRSVELSPVPVEVEAGSVGNLFLAVGHGTGFVGGLTVAHVPPESGLRVSRVDVYGRDLAIVEVDSSTDAVPGTYGLTLSTGGEAGLAAITVVESLTARSASVVPEASVEGLTWTTINIAGSNTLFRSGVTQVSSAVVTPGPSTNPYDEALHLGAPLVTGLESLSIEIDPDPAHEIWTGLAFPLTIPLAVTTDLEVVRASLAIVGTYGDTYSSVEPLALRPSTSVTLVVTARDPSPPPDISFMSDTPTASPVSGGLAVVGAVDVRDDAVAWVNLDVAEDAGNPAVLRFHGTDYEWSILLPVLPTAPEISLVGSSTLAAGTRGGTLTVESSGFGLDDVSLSSASPGGMLFVDATTSTGTASAEVSYDTAILESAGSTVLFVMPEATPWCMPVALDIDPADVRVISPPSSVLETIPTSGPDDVGFTPATSGESFGLWAVVDGGTTGVPWSLIGSDGISVLGRSDGSTAAALLAPPSEAHYVGVGDATLAGTDYWIAVADVLGHLVHSEIEPNDSILDAEGVSGPGSGDVVLAAINAPGDRDVYSLTYAGTGFPCYEVVSTRWIASTFSSPYVGLSMLDDTSTVIPPPASGLGGDSMDRIICTTGDPDEDYLRVEGLAGTSGPYLLVPRWPVIVSEIDHNVPFVELSGMPGYDLTGYVLEVYVGSCSVWSTVSLSSVPGGVVPDDGYVLVASPGAVTGADVEDAILDTMVPPYALHVGHGGDHTYDRVQVGGTFTCGEGSAIAPADMPAGRLWGLDTDQNAADFTRLVDATPGGPNALPVP